MVCSVSGFPNVILCRRWKSVGRRPHASHTLIRTVPVNIVACGHQPSARRSPADCPPSLFVVAATLFDNRRNRVDYTIHHHHRHHRHTPRIYTQRRTHTNALAHLQPRLDERGWWCVDMVWRGCTMRDLLTVSCCWRGGWRGDTWTSTHTRPPTRNAKKNQNESPIRLNWTFANLQQQFV